MQVLMTNLPELMVLITARAAAEVAAMADLG